MLSAAVLAPVALLCVWVGGWPWAILILALAILLLREWFMLAAGRVGWLWHVGGAAYLLAASGAIGWLRRDPVVGLQNVLFVIAVVWSADIGAYAVGRLVGGPKLAPAISPGKTWSGAAGGTLASVLAGLIVAAVRGGAAGPAALALVLSICSQAGDLAESALKRRLGVKDSGTLLPGHGGLLDRLDGMLLAGPVAYLLAAYLGPGVELWR